MCLFLSHIKSIDVVSLVLLWCFMVAETQLHSMLLFHQRWLPFPKPLDVQDDCWIHLSLPHPGSRKKEGEKKKNMPPSLKIFPEVAHNFHLCSLGQNSVIWPHYFWEDRNVVFIIRDCV